MDREVADYLAKYIKHELFECNKTRVEIDAKMIQLAWEAYESTHDCILHTTTVRQHTDIEGVYYNADRCLLMQW